MCHDVFSMRTTLTIDDDLAGILQKKASQHGHSFKEVVNDLLRAGIAASGDAVHRRKPVKVVTKPLGLKPGYDPDKLNQLVDELAVEDYLRKAAQDDTPGR
jgi:plasmid stability protein